MSETISELLRRLGNDRRWAADQISDLLTAWETSLELIRELRDALIEIHTHIGANQEEAKASHSAALQILKDVEYNAGRFRSLRHGTTLARATAHLERGGPEAGKGGA